MSRPGMGSPGEESPEGGETSGSKGSEDGVKAAATAREEKKALTWMSARGAAVLMVVAADMEALDSARPSA